MFVEGDMLIRMKELSSIKTLGEVTSGTQNMIFSESLSKFCTQWENAKLYTLLYNVTNVATYAYYNITMHYDYYNVNMKLT